MGRRFPLSRRLVALLFFSGAVVAGCGPSMRTRSGGISHPPALPSVAPVPAAVSAPAPPPEDPVLTLIADSDRHFKAGQRELELGHVEAAKQEFNRAVNGLLESPYGARTEPRIREHFDRLVDRISAYEVKALAEGDGFTEKRYETASIDELLALSATFDRPAPAPELKSTVETDLETTGHDIPIPLNQRVLSYIELFQGRLHDFIEEGMKRGTRSLPTIQSAFRDAGLPAAPAYLPLT